MQELPVNIVDLVVIALLLLSGVLAFFRGFVHEVLAIAAWIGAALAALFGLPHARELARQLIPIDWAADAAAGGAIFLIVLVLLSLLTRMISQRVQESALNSLDRALGFLFGLARAVLFLAIAHVFLVWLFPPDNQPQWMAQSRTLPLIAEVSQRLEGMVPESLKSDAEGAARDAADKAQQAIEAERQFRQLTSPPPEAPEDSGESDQPGYGEDARQDMDRLIQSTQ
ncbi:CvpA family protein [Roseospirillum parvum]|uniref:Membrane protein required for colicin V production n=1 Tax=Roseospirillum parvum TaxID=83401 RepID=A0A1G8AZ54_9PROT|nr:CvpA family protein [Roseospirillum parvum]SDH26211.1 membrane protein required for colicin V production [Roseospirillum parvum]